MKLYHIVIMTIIAVGFIISFTAFGDSQGLIFDLKDYNADINTSLYTTFDIREEINSEISTLKNDTESQTITTQDTEQDIYKRLWGATKNMATGFVSSYKMMTTASTELGLPTIVFWVVTTLLALFVVVKLTGRFFLDR